MRHSILRAVLTILAAVAALGCPVSPIFNDFLFKNNSDIEIRLFMNVHYPDSSFQRAVGAGYLEAQDRIYPNGSFDLKQYQGLTLFVFDYDYWKSRWHDGVGLPHTYLDEGEILKSYYHSKEELDTLGWELTYP